MMPADAAWLRHGTELDRDLLGVAALPVDLAGEDPAGAGTWEAGLRRQLRAKRAQPRAAIAHGRHQDRELGYEALAGARDFVPGLSRPGRPELA